jgi:predicted nucleic acid-binding protein
VDTGEEVFITGIILQEVLQAFRTEASFSKIVRYMEPFPLLEPCREDYIASARLHRTCAAKGITTSTVDCHIAAVAIQNSCYLLTTDKDFQRIARISNLKLA